MGRFSGVKDASWNPGGVYFEPGIFLVRVDAVKCIESRKKEEMTIVETTILESDNPKLKRGSSCAWINMASWDTYLGNLKHFASIAGETEMDDVDEAGLELMVSEENPYGGIILCVKAMNVKKKNGEDFTKCVWSWPEKEDFERIGYNPDGTKKVKPAEQVAKTA